MTAKRIEKRVSSRGKRSIDLNLVTSFTFIVIFIFQATRFTSIDTEGILATKKDLVGTWLGLLISLFFGVQVFSEKKLNTAAVTIFLSFLLYLAFVIITSKPSESLVGLYFSRHGIFTWFVLGLGLSVSLDRINEFYHSSYYYKKYYFAWIITVSSLIFIFVSAKYLREADKEYSSYQQAASSACILFISLSLFITAIWNRKIPLLIVALYLISSTALALQVALAESTAVVAIWIPIAAIVYIGSFMNSGKTAKPYLLTAGVLAVFIFLQSDVFKEFSRETRFNSWFERTGNLSSMETRITLLPYFKEQFSISPILGHYAAEQLTGAPDYIHSLPLSLLTHTGIVGFLLALSLLLVIVKKLAITRVFTFDLYHQKCLLVIVVTLFATVATFFSWPAFWFGCGLLCTTTSKRYN